MLIGIFSGSFNPIHNGHTQLAQFIVNHTPLDEVWMMVTPHNPLKPANGLLQDHIRLQLVQLATEDLKGVKASDFELNMPQPNYTIHTLDALEKAFPQHQFALIIGSDNMAIFHQWKDYQRILQTRPIYVYPRKGDDIQKLQHNYPQMQLIPDAPLWEISSTQIRENVHNEPFLEFWLHPKVKDFLKKNSDLFAYVN